MSYFDVLNEELDVSAGVSRNMARKQDLMLLTVIQNKTNYILDNCHSKGIPGSMLVFPGIPGAIH